MLKVASYNIHKCVGTDGVFSPERIISVLAEMKADVVALQEADVRFGDREGLLDLEHLTKDTGLIHVPLAGSGRSHGWRGNVILVREAVIADAHQLVLPGVEPRGAVVVDMEAKGLALRVIGTHLGLLRTSRQKQAKAILKSAEEANGRTVLLMGDLNEWRIGRRSALSLLFPVFGPREAFTPTYPSQFPVLALDRILSRPGRCLYSFALHSTPLSKLASDHLPITALVRPVGEHSPGT
jgi:endonuclease/exonuclease/phosphatase family metal-dependent hydrolase